MGITKETFDIYKRIYKSNHIDFNKRLKVMDFGAQTIHFDDIGVYNSFLDEISSQISLNHLKYNSPAKDFHESMGHEYDCVDLDPLIPTALKWDLNTQVCPDDVKNKYDMVSNHGTTEHLIGQVSAFKLMHDLTKPNGIMLHSLPCVEPNHGFFSYSPVFFKSLSHANDYEILFFALTPLMNQHHPVSFHVDVNIPACMQQYPSCYVHVVFKKKNADEFKLPTQIFQFGEKR